MTNLIVATILTNTLEKKKITITLAPGQKSWMPIHWQIRNKGYHSYKLLTYKHFKIN